MIDEVRKKERSIAKAKIRNSQHPILIQYNTYLDLTVMTDKLSCRN